MHRINLTLVNFLIFTIVTSAIAYYIVVRAYDSFEGGVDELTLDGMLSR